MPMSRARDRDRVSRRRPVDGVAAHTGSMNVNRLRPLPQR
jgi:hypothetical protein